MKVSIIGAGNVSWYLSSQLSLHDAIHLEVHHRSELNPTWNSFSNISFKKSHKISSDSDFVIFTVSDDSLLDAIESFQYATEQVILHVSGTHPMDILGSKNHNYYGVLYPLQTVSMGRKPIKVPLLIEGKSPQILNNIQFLAQLISTDIVEMNSKERFALHRSSVFASNFVNYMLTLSNHLLANPEKFRLLEPLVQETLLKAFEMSPEVAQTGPAKRKDLKIIDKHINSIDDPKIRNLYQLITDHIMDQNG